MSVAPLVWATGAAAAWFLLFVVGHLTWNHLIEHPRHGQIIVRFFSMSAFACAATVISPHWFASDSSFQTWILAAAISVFLMCCAFVLYMPFVFVVSSSLSIDTIIMLEAAGGSAPVSLLKSRFASADAVRRRFELMRENGMLYASGDRYALTPKSRRVAAFFAAMKRFWKLWPGG